MSERQTPEICGHCHLPIHPSEIGKRYFGTSTAHQEYRCLELLRMKVTEAERQRDELSRQLYDLLAVIHRDGGHHREAVGTAQACLDAHKAWHLRTLRIDQLAEALRICRGFVDAYGQPETKERLDAILARIDAEKEPTDAR